MDREWLDIKSSLQKSLSKGQYELWVCTIDFLGVKDECLQLGFRNRFHIEWIREKLGKQILGEARKCFPGLKRLEYQVMQDALSDKPGEQPEGPVQINFNDLIKRTGPAFNPNFTFDQFVVGNCNQFAYAASMAMASCQNFCNQSVYLLSNTGLGKSHLSHAVGNYLAGARPDLRVQYLTTEQFANEMIFALRHGNIESFKDKYRKGCDILLLEKLDFLSGKEKVQTELVYTLDELMNHGKKILCTGNAYPKDIPKLSTDLKSRLGGVLVAPISPPDFTTRVEILRKKARNEGAKIPTDVLEYLADTVSGDVRQLESCLVGVIAKTSIFNLPPTLDLAEDVTRTMLNHLPKITIDYIQQVVCNSFQISPEELKSVSRRKELAIARKIAMYLCRRYTTESLTAIGKFFGRSHSSVLYAINGVDKEVEDTNGKLKRHVEYVIRRLETGCLSA